MSTQITLRRDIASNWTSVNPILALAEIGLITDASDYTIKIGDGSTTWNNLPAIVLSTNQSQGVAAIDVAELLTTPNVSYVYLAAEVGTYTLFKDSNNDSIVLADGELVLLVYSGSYWVKKTITNFFNYIQFYNLKRGVQTKAAARNAVPTALRSTGLVITYVYGNGQYTEQFIGGTYSVNDEDWQEFGVASGAVLYTAQSLTSAQQQQVLTNLGILSNIQYWSALLAAGYQFIGVAATSTTPTTIANQPTSKLFAISSGAGTYSNFKDSSNNSLVVADGELAVFLSSNNGTSWTKATVLSTSGNISQYLGYVDYLLDGYTFRGFITPTSTIPAPLAKCYYIATTNGNYTQFGITGGYNLSDKVVYFIWDSTQWIVQEIDILPIAVYNQQLAIVNVNFHNPGVSISSKAQARGLVPAQFQRQGIIISYCDSNNVGYCEMYLKHTSGWSTDDQYYISLLGQAPQWQSIS